MSVFKFIRSAALALSVAFTGVAFTTGAAHADKPPVFVDTFAPAAAGGYDVTSYFSGTPVVGSAQFTATHNGATYRFANAANRAKFVASPAQYAPQYGGYCAWAVSQGYTAPGRPLFWRIVDGKLYFNYNAQVQRRWEASIPTFITSANTNWPNVLKK